MTILAPYDVLDVGSLPWDTKIGGERISNIVTAHRPAMEELGRSGILDPDRASFGFALADPFVRYQEFWENPQALIWAVGGWGPEMERYVANAVRKIRAAARENKDTLALSAKATHQFRHVVQSVEADGRFLWGDFPHGTALFLEMGGTRFLGSASTYKPEKDGVAAALITADIAARMFRFEQGSSHRGGVSAFWHIISAA